MEEKSIVYLLIRVILGCIFIYHGVSKLGTGYYPWISYMDKQGINSWLAILAIAVEVLVGICLVTGLFSRIASIVGILFMIIALYIAHSKDPIIGDKGCSYQILIILLCIGIALTGPGRYRIVNNI